MIDEGNVMKKNNVKNRFRYFKEKHMSALIMILLLCLNLALVVIGCLLLRVLPENRGLSFGDALWQSLRLILDPGGFLGSKLSAVTTIVTSVIVLCGTVTFTGGVIGYVTNIITNAIDNSKNGSNDINFEDFTLILNWNERAMAIILDYWRDVNRDKNNDYIVILSEHDKADLEEQIKKRIKALKNENVNDTKAPKIIVRSGNPRQLSDLISVSYFNADIIYVMQREGDETPDFEVIQTCMAISGLSRSFSSGSDSGTEEEYRKEIRIVADTTSAEAANMLSNATINSLKADNLSFDFSLSTIKNDLTLGKILAAVSLNPGLGGVLPEILSKTGSEFVEYETDGRYTFEDDLRSLKYALPIYDINGKRLYLSMNSLSDGEEFERLGEDEIKIESKGEKYSPKTESSEQTVVIWGYNNKLKYILKSFAANNRDEEAVHCKVVLISANDKKGKIEKIYRNNSFTDLFCSEPIFVDRGYGVGTALSGLPDEIHSFLILSRDDYYRDEKDKEVFEVWMALHKEMKNDEKIREKLDGKVILEVSNTNNAQILKSNAKDQIVVSSELSCLFMVQLATGKDLQNVLYDFICAETDEDMRNEHLSGELNYDLGIMSVREFFDSSEKQEFIGKQDVVFNVYEGTNGKYIPIGIIKDGTPYLFTNGGKRAEKDFLLLFEPCMSDGLLVMGDSEAITNYEENGGIPKLTLEPEWELIYIKKRSA